jgi:hypothetical protein
MNALVNRVNSKKIIFGFSFKVSYIDYSDFLLSQLSSFY